jgi:uncharacterized protein YqhQ
MKMFIYIYCYLRKYYKKEDENISDASLQAFIVFSGYLSLSLFGIILIVSGLLKNFSLLDFLSSFESIIRRFIVIPLLCLIPFSVIYIIGRLKKYEIEKIQIEIDKGHKYSKTPGRVVIYVGMISWFVLLLGLFSVTVFQDL